jgi:hypothetical protein
MTNLAALLERSGRPDWQVAADCGIHPTQLSLYKTGARAIHERHAAYLADYFGVPVAAITDELEVPWQELEEQALVNVRGDDGGGGDRRAEQSEDQETSIRD